MLHSSLFALLAAGLVAGTPLSTLEKNVKESPDDIQARLRLAREYFDAGQDDKANEQLDVVGDLMEKAGLYEEAYVLFRKLAEVDRRHWARIGHLQDVMGPDATHAAMLVYGLSRAKDPAERAKLEKLLADLRTKIAAENANPLSISELEKRHAEDPRDEQVQFRLVTEYRKAGETSKAARVLEGAGDRYAAEGHLLKAIGNYRKAIGLDASRYANWQKIAQAEAELDLHEEALESYRVFARELEKRGRKKEAAEARKRMEEQRAKLKAERG